MDKGNQRNNRRPEQPVEPKEFDERVVSVDRVARVVKGGRRFRFRSLVVLGDHKGRVGMGVAKGQDVSLATTKATEIAKKNMIKVNLYKGTIPHEVTAKVGGSNILLKPAAPGTGLIAGSTIRVVLEVLGIENIISKTLGGSNKINACYATIEALKLLQSQKDWTITKSTKAKKSKSAKVEA